MKNLNQTSSYRTNNNFLSATDATKFILAVDSALLEEVTYSGETEEKWRVHVRVLGNVGDTHYNEQATDAPAYIITFNQATPVGRLLAGMTQADFPFTCKVVPVTTRNGRRTFDLAPVDEIEGGF